MIGPCLSCSSTSTILYINTKHISSLSQLLAMKCIFIPNWHSPSGTITYVSHVNNNFSHVIVWRCILTLFTETQVSPCYLVNSEKKITSEKWNVRFHMERLRDLSVMVKFLSHDWGWTWIRTQIRDESKSVKSQNIFLLLLFHIVTLSDHNMSSPVSLLFFERYIHMRIVSKHINLHVGKVIFTILTHLNQVILIRKEHKG